MRFMLISAVDLHHSLNSCFLSFYPLFFAEHAECNKSVTVDGVYEFS
jgi:hypothetical protein